MKLVARDNRIEPDILMPITTAVSFVSNSSQLVIYMHKLVLDRSELSGQGNLP